ncbi:hypothetical protein AB0454_22680 [Streptomyces sp. NPDC093509]|uniref:hypothetical protein n=1 Tax=Streptomyces sp. NPDC093509 TaxID=3154982 RepID=UPI00344BBA10
MSSPTIATSPFSTNPDYARGRADAYDDSKTHHPETIQANANLAIDFVTPNSSQATRMYAAGYAKSAVEILNDHIAAKTTQTAKALKWWDRKNGREA